MVIKSVYDIDWVSTTVVFATILILALILAQVLPLRWDSTIEKIDLGTSRRALVPRIAGFTWAKFILFFWTLASVVLIFEVCDQDPEGLFGQTTAAWVQALGAVGAILVAIAVDQGSSRRLQREQIEKERSIAARRCGAINRAADALRDIESEVRSNQNTLSGISISTINIQRLNSSLASLEYLYNQGAEIDIQILSSLCTSLEQLKTDVKWITENQPIVGLQAATDFIEYVSNAEKMQRDTFYELFKLIHRIFAI